MNETPCVTGLLEKWFKSSDLEVSGQVEDIEPLTSALAARMTSLIEEYNLTAFLDDIGDSVDSQWSIVCSQLAVLKALCDHLKKEKEKPDAASTADILSFNQQKCVEKMLQIIVAFGVAPAMLPGVGPPLAARSSLGLLFACKQSATSWETKQKRLFYCVRCLLGLTTSPSLGSFVCSKILGDLLAALMQLGHAPRAAIGGNCLSDEERRICRCDLHYLLKRLYQPVVLKEILILQAAPNAMLKKAENVPISPPWLRNLCSHLLWERLAETEGVTSLLKAVLEVSNGTTDKSWLKTEAIAKMIANCPQKKQEEYYQNISTQMTKLLRLKGGSETSRFSEIAVVTIRLMYKNMPEIVSAAIMTPMMKPILVAAEKSLATLPSVFEVAKVKDLSEAVNDLHKVTSIVKLLFRITYLQLFCLVPMATASLLKSLEKVLRFTFYLSTTNHVGLRELRELCSELLLTFCKNSDHDDVISAFTEIMTDDVWLGLKVELASEGEIVIVKVPAEEQLAEIETWQHRSSCLFKLVSELSDDISADFFLILFQKLTFVLENESKEREPTEPAHEDLKQLYNKMFLMFLMEKFTENLSEKIFTKIDRIICFIETNLKRLIAVMESMEESFLGDESIQMTFTLVSTIIYTQEITPTQWDKMSTLVPLLLSISNNHNNQSIRQQAASLRISIATHARIPVATEQKECVASVDDVMSTLDIADTERNTVWAKAMAEAHSDEIPIKGHGLIALRQLIEVKDKVTTSKMSANMAVFRSALDHVDSYVYLAAVQGLAALGNKYPKEILPQLAAEYCGQKQAMTVESRLKIGEAMVKVTRTLGQMAPHYCDVLMTSFMHGVRSQDALVRASSLENIGELCKLLRFSLGRVATEVLECAGAVLQLDEAVETRQAAASLLYLLLQGLDREVVRSNGAVIRDLFRTLKRVRDTEKEDKVLRLVSLALDEIDAVLKDLFFPQQKLQKRIFVLDPPSDDAT